MEKEAKIIPLKKTAHQKENLTPEKLKTFSGMENMNDQDVIETVFDLQTLANILYDFMAESSSSNQAKKAA